MKDADMESNSSSSDSGSDMEEDINEDEINKEIILYKQKISENENDYDAHLNLTKAYRKLAEMDDLREARIHFSKVYPLSPDIWLQWLKDEQSICTNNDERSEIIDLFEKAVKDYINVQIWVEYILFMLKGGNHEATRELCERALTAVGIHFADGILIWQAVMLVEQQLYASLQAEAKEDRMAEQKKRIEGLYRRQARVPLLNLAEEEFLAEASIWFDGQLENMQTDLKNSLKLTSSLVSYEKALIAANGDVEKLEAYRKYLDYVRKNSSPAFIQITYERAAADLCLHAGIWEEYIKFALEQFPHAGYVVLPICERSQRNCPWSAALSGLHIRALQKYKSDSIDLKSLVKGCIQKTLLSGIEDKDELNRLWMSYLVFLRMQIDWEGDHDQSLQHFRDACHQAADLICEVVEDADCEILRYLARIEAHFVKSIENVRTIYNDKILRYANNYKRKDLWLEFIGLERICGSTKHARKLFRRALERVWDDVEDVAEQFLKFEQEAGTLEMMEDFERKYRDRLAIVQKRRLEEFAKTGHANQATPKYDKSRTEFQTSVRKPVRTVENEFKKKMKPEPVQKQENKSSYKRSAEETDSRPAKKPKVASSSTHGEHVKHDASNDYRSVFLSNLDFASDRDDILPVFADCGDIESFRLVSDYKGRSKGFGYLVFLRADSVKLALAKDRTPLGSRPMFVSRCDVAKTGHSFQYGTGLEKEKLFVKGLPVTMKEAEIRTAFSVQGKIKELRIVTHRNGFSKGWCYITYFTADQAEKTRQAMDGTDIQGATVTVLISNPSAKFAPPSQAALQSKFSKAGGSNQVSGHQRTRVSFVPRALAVKKKAEPSDVKNESEITTIPKTNEEFRKMLLK